VERPEPHRAGVAAARRVLLVFVLIEVFHTLRFAVAQRELRAEPFLMWL